MAKHLIVNADDFGLCRGVNRGIVEACTGGIVTSTSLMVRQPAAAEAAEYMKRGVPSCVGLHIDLGEWIFKEGEWRPLYTVTDTNDPDSIRLEVERQLAEFHRLTGRNPSHLDSHQHVHRNEPARSVCMDLARQLNIPLRESNQAIAYCGDFYGQDAESLPYHEAISTSALMEIIARLPDGVTELCCHPGYTEDLDSAYKEERLLELSVLCDPAIHAKLQRCAVRLCSFADLKQIGRWP